MKNNKRYVMKTGAVWLETILADSETRSTYDDRNEEDYLLDGYLVLSEDEMVAEINKNEDEKYLNEWLEIDEDYWWEMLEVLPPMKWQHKGTWEFFFISEATTSNIHACYAKHGKKYYTANRRTSVNYGDFVKEIIEQFKIGDDNA